MIINYEYQSVVVVFKITKRKANNEQQNLSNAYNLSLKLKNTINNPYILSNSELMLNSGQITSHSDQFQLFEINWWL